MDSTAYSVPGIVQVADLCPFSHNAVCIAITQHTILALAWCHSLCRAEPPEPAAQKDERKARQDELTENQCFLPFLAVAIHRAGGSVYRVQKLRWETQAVRLASPGLTSQRIECLPQMRHFSHAPHVASE
eukprot:CAMPEP_0174345278 /NCGR_PEP_ID=MMETSP0811_2-20130205/736_1 /TAXON_ID=73025 ORGANISM="Eutreptiella gymnastica-like, Strain CCMP1594" /NCGR_SAMPLE_ID=MMETSP0811_2 /ASSEMBLY_ACC=CAM_ASM_000667 /LENGTH=129 /DNA_ID=CAMNT_0015468887 /DNA_START=514 /DNA_END=904 /DNA_ORIENTATION=+